MLLIIVLASTATVLCYRAVQSRFGSQLRTAVHQELSELFPKADIFIGRVAFDDRSTILINDLRMATVSEGKRQQILSAEQVLIGGQFDVSDFLKQTARVERVHLIGVQVSVWPFESGGWSLERLKPQPKPNRSPPEIVLERSSLKVRQSADPAAHEVILHDVEATIRPVTCNAYSSPDGTIELQHQFQANATGRSSGLLGAISVQSTFDSKLESVEFSGEFSGLHFSQRLLESLPAYMADRMTQLAGLECETSCSQFRVFYASGRPPEFSCQGTITSGKLKHPRLPYQLEKINSDFFFKNSLLQIRDMSARSGGATLKFDTDIMGLGLDSPMVIQAQVQDLELDQRLYASLPETFQQQWDRLQLTGRVSGDVKLYFDGVNWRQAAAIDCQKISIRPWIFPYPFTQVEGKVIYENGQISSECLTGRAGGQLVESSLQLSLVDTQWIGRLYCRSHGPVAIDEELISAFTPTGLPTRDAEKFVRSLNLAGGVELVNITFERTDPLSPKWNRVIDAHVYDGRLQYDSFQYPIYNIRGRIVNRDEQWSLESFEGRNDSARVLFSGQWHEVEQGSLPFRLQYEAYAVPLAEDLFRALPKEVQNVWSQLQPTGTISQVFAVIERETPTSQIDTQVIISEQSDTGSQPGKSLRLYPYDFPYHLNDVNCQVVYQDGVVTIQRATAQNGATRLALRGVCKPRTDGLWQGEFQWLPSTRLMVDGQLIKALPKDVQEPIQKMDFRGPISVLGTSHILFGDLQKKPEVSWDCQFDVEDGQLADGQYVNAMRGTIWSNGSSTNGRLTASGNLSMDALRVMNIPITNLLGPFSVVDNKLYFGSAVRRVTESTQVSEPSEMTASTLSGTLRLSGYSLLETGKVQLDAALENADLSTLLLELGVAQPQTQAVCNAQLKDFRGIPWIPQTFHGSGSVQLTDAKLYELPFMMRLLSVAAVSANDASAFQRADINFNIDGDHIPLKIAADGEVLRVRGEGWTNLRRDVDLQLYTYVGRRLPIGNAVTPLLAESRFATFMMVEVSGTLDNPLMQRRPFPQIEATLQQIFPEVAEQRPFREAIDRWRN